MTPWVSHIELIGLHACHLAQSSNECVLWRWSPALFDIGPTCSLVGHASHATGRCVGMPRCPMGQPPSKSNRPHAHRNNACTIYATFCFSNLFVQLSNLLSWIVELMHESVNAWDRKSDVFPLLVHRTMSMVNGDCMGKWRLFFALHWIVANTVHSCQISFGAGIVNLSHTYFTGRSFFDHHYAWNALRTGHEYVSYNYCVH